MEVTLEDSREQDLQQQTGTLTLPMEELLSNH